MMSLWNEREKYLKFERVMQRAEAANTAANASQLATSKLNITTGPNRPVTFVKSNTFQRVLPQRPAQAGKTPEAKPPQVSGSSAKLNYPPKQQTQTRP
jgi:hypothetical protein